LKAKLESNLSHFNFIISVKANLEINLSHFNFIIAVKAKLESNLSHFSFSAKTQALPRCVSSRQPAPPYHVGG
jgi:hypothetical protein